MPTSSEAEDRADLYERLGAVEDDSWWVDLARTSPDGWVIEFGAGAGRLTRALRGTGAGVTAIESDPAMLARLHAATAADGGIEVVDADVAAIRTGRRAGLVVLPAGLVNELPDATARRAAFVSAASCCAPGGLVALQLLSPWWLARLAGRTQGRLSPLRFSPLRPGDDGGEAVEVAIEAGDLDPWQGRRHATLTYRFPDGVVRVDELDAAVVTGAELSMLLQAAGLGIRAVYGARPPAPVSADDVVWHVLAAPAVPGD